MIQLRHFTTKRIKIAEIKAMVATRGLYFIHFNDSFKTHVHPNVIGRIEYFLPAGKRLEYYKTFGIGEKISRTFEWLRDIDDTVGAVVLDYFDALIHPGYDECIVEMRNIALSWADRLPCPLIIINRYTLK